MHLSDTEDFAIQAKVAGLLGAEIYDDLFDSVSFAEVDQDVLLAYVNDAGKADDIESMYCFEISAAAETVLKRKIELVMVLPRALVH